jgi:uncharacterized membrane protein
MDDSHFFLGLASVLLVLTHVVPSSVGVRRRLVTMLGETVFAAAYSLLALLMIVWTVIEYRNASTVYLWNPGLLRVLPLIVMPFAMILLVASGLSRNPTVYGKGDELKEDAGAKGMIRITRHPFLWAVMLWAAAHIAANGDLASLLFFGGYLALAAVGSVALDRKYADRYGEAWIPFARQTSNLPFAAVLAGRNRVIWGEIGWLIPVLGLAIYGAVLVGHQWLFGVRPW